MARRSRCPQAPGRWWAGLLGLALFGALEWASGARPAVGQSVSFAANDVEFLNLMGDLEAPRGFGAVTGFAPIPPPRPLTEMTLDEVLHYQERIRGMRSASSAVGRYQFIYPTLRRLVQDLGIAGHLRFDAEVQTYLARFLMHDCGFYAPETDLLRLADCLAGVWAALPRVTGPDRGRSVYADDGLNRALTTPETVLAVLARRFDW